MEENVMKYVTRANSTPNGKPRVYFTCHPDDFDKYFQKICDDIFKSHNPVIYYTSDMTAEFDEKNKEADLGRINLFVIPVTYNLLTTKNRAMDHDFPYAKQNNIPVLPLMMESGLDSLYSAKNKFAEIQYLNPYSTDHTEISYEEKLKKYLNAVLISDELAKRVRGAFDAYIFLSYRKKDRSYANKLIKLIHNNPEWRDIAIWFDEFLSPGESFKENIDKILKDSEMFALLVTPNLLEEPDGRPNFVMAKEYPAALESGMKILPTEMEETDKEELARKFRDIPPCIKPETEFEVLKSVLAETLTMAAKSQNDNDPEHNFLIGLAYLEGIDVEVDKERGLDLITSAAYDGLVEAMIKLRDMYSERINNTESQKRAMWWAGKVYRYYRRNMGDEHRDTLVALNAYADLCRGNGEYKFAHELSENTYELCRKVFGETHSETLIAYNVFAMSSEKVLTFEESAALIKKANTLCADSLGKEHPVTLVSVNNLADFYYNNKKYKEAYSFYEKAYKLRCEFLGEGNPDTLRSMDGLCDTLEKLKKYKRALKLREEEHHLYCNILGEDHPDTLSKLHDLAKLYNKARKKAKAAEYFEKAYKLRSYCLGIDDHDTLRSLLELSDVYGKMWKFTKASKCSLQYAIDRKPKFNEDWLPSISNYSKLTDENRSELRSIFNLAVSCEESGEKDREIEAYEKIYNRTLEIFGEGNMLTQTILTLIVLRTWKLRRFKKHFKYYYVMYTTNIKMLGVMIKELFRLIKK